MYYPRIPPPETPRDEGGAGDGDNVPRRPQLPFKSCQEALGSLPWARTGIYLLLMRHSSNSSAFSVSAARCQMDDHDDGDPAGIGGGWTVIQRRGQFGNPMDYFDRVKEYSVESHAVFRSHINKQRPALQ